VGASKEALIQVKLMNERLKEAYDASEALQTNVRLSTIVSTISSRSLGVAFLFSSSSSEWMVVFLSVGLRGAHPLGVVVPMGAR
jgi:hypothetical protein